MSASEASEISVGIPCTMALGGATSILKQVQLDNGGWVDGLNTNWKHAYYSREAKAERTRVRAAMLMVRYLYKRGRAALVACPPWRGAAVAASVASGAAASVALAA